MSLFAGVKYYISSAFPKQRQDELSTFLDANGAVREEVEDASHVIARSLRFEGWENAKEDVAVVSSEWVDRTVVYGKMLDVKIFSVDPKMIFSGVIATTADLDSNDKEVIQAGINALGGLFREGYTRDITHLLVPRPGSEKYSAALHFRESTKVQVLLPQWFDDCFRLLQRLDETPYTWPDPAILNAPQGESSSGRKGGRLSYEKKTMITMAKLADDRESSEVPPAITNIWKKRKILFSASLALQESRREAVEVAVKRAGGNLVVLDYSLPQDELEKEEEDKIAGADILIIQRRPIGSYIKAVRAKKTVGTLAWLFHVHKTGLFTSPLDQLLHYPIRSDRIDGFEQQKITLTNYAGEAREYLKKLITLMGGEGTFTPEMSQANTAVVAATLAGKKTDKAREWSIPIVNHTWLEDSFVAWKCLTPALAKYIAFPDGVDFSTILGQRGVGPVSEDELKELESEVKKERDTRKENAKPKPLSDKGKAKPVATSSSMLSATPRGTAGSTREADELAEVEDVVGLGDDINDVDFSFINENGDGPVEMDVDDVKEEETSRPLAEKSLNRRSSGRPAPSSRNRRNGDVPTEEEEEEEELTQTSTRSASRAKVSEKPSAKKSLPPKRRAQPEEEEEEEEEEEREEEERPRSRKATTSRTHVSGDEETDGRRSTRTTRSKPTARRDSVCKKKPQRHQAKDTDEEDESPSDAIEVKKEKPSAPKKTRSSSHNEKGSKSTKGQSWQADDETDEEEESDALPSRSTRSRAKGKAKAVASDTEADDDDDDDSDDVDVKRKSKPPAKAKPAVPKPVKKKGTLDAPIELESSEDELSPVGPSRQTRSSTSKSPTKQQTTKGLANDSDHSDENTERRVLRSVTKTPAKNSSTSPRSLRKHASVPGPNQPIPIVEIISPKQPLRLPQSSLGRTRSLNAIGPQRALSFASPKRIDATERARGRRSESRNSDEDEDSPKPAPKVKKEYTHEERVKFSSRPMPIIETKPSSSTRSPSRRAAKKNAEEKILESAKDMTLFQKQMKNGRIRGSWEKDLKGKGKEVDDKKRRYSVATSHEEDPTETDTEMNLRDSKKRKVENSKSNGIKREAEDSDHRSNQRTAKKARFSEEIPSDTDSHNLHRGKSRGKSSQSDILKPQNDVRVLTTMVSLEDSERKAFAKLGAKFTDKPKECTHLIAPHITRSAKFLCAMRNGPHILTKKWITDSIKKREILPISAPEKYAIPDTEKRQSLYNFELEKALERARKNPGGVFEGKTFYVSPKVQGVQDIRVVIESAGGKIANDKPNARVLAAQNGDCFVVSCKEDEDYWRPIKHFQIYDRDFVLAGVLTQRVERDKHYLKNEKDSFF